MEPADIADKKTAAVYVDVKALKPWVKNPRKNEAAVGAVADSIKRFGFGAPLLARKANGEIIAGHTRLKAALKMGLTEVPVRYLDLTEAEAHALALADNKVGELADWDDALLTEVLKGMADAGENIEKLGWSSNEIEKMIRAGDAGEDGEVIEPPAEPTTKTGDLWLLGEHRLLCGDSTKVDDVARLMGGAKADLMLTDPPYNVDYTGKTKDALKVANDSMEDTDFREFLRSCFESAFNILKPGASFYVFHADLEGYNFRGSVKDCGQEVRQCLIWVKDVLVMGRQDYQWQHEPCLYGWKDGAAHGWYSDRKQTTLLRFDRPTRSEDHPTMKPVEMFVYLMGNSTAPQGLAYDPFLGSGTTLIAAEQLGRKCYGMELSPAYCDVIVKRWETMTGKKAVLSE